MMIYAINKKTKEHIATNLSEWNAGKWPSMKWIVVGTDADGWIPWNAASGRECPISKDQNYVVKLANGEDIDCTLNRPVIYWDDNPPSSTRVIAYKPILEESSGISRTPIMDSYRESQEMYKTEWDDNEIPGLPSVGCIVEAYDGGRWAEAEFLKYHNNSYAVFFIKSRALCWATDIRPAKSKDERAIDELAMDILDTVNRDGVDFKHHEKRIAERLYVMGYRKVED